MRAMGILKMLLKILALALVGAHVLVYFFQEKLIFLPEKLGADFRFHFSRPFEEFSIPRDGAILNALRFRVENPKGIIVYFHGNAGSLREWGETGATLSRLGYEVLIYDYRGYGKSTGRIRSESELVDDARAVVAVARKDYPEDRLVLFGRSLGSGIAVQLAAEMKPRLLILESPYRNVTGVARKQYPFLAPFIVRYPFRSDRFAKKVASPVVVIHGEFDEVIPVGFAENLVEDFAFPVGYHRIAGGHHNDLDQFPDYRTALEKALAI